MNNVYGVPLYTCIPLYMDPYMLSTQPLETVCSRAGLSTYVIDWGSYKTVNVLNYPIFVLKKCTCIARSLEGYAPKC